jgi:hypothetical protein
LDTYIIEELLHQCEYENISIISQPQKSYRGRYECEINGHASRFIQAENKTNGHPYPAIKVFIYSLIKFFDRNEARGSLGIYNLKILIEQIMNMYVSEVG